MNHKRHPAEAFGLSEREEQIVLALEKNTTPGAIARHFGISLASVMVIKGRYIITDKHLNGFERRCRASEARYRAALAATGKVFA